MTYLLYNYDDLLSRSLSLRSDNSLDVFHQVVKRLEIYTVRLFVFQRRYFAIKTLPIEISTPATDPDLRGCVTLLNSLKTQIRECDPRQLRLAA